MPKKEEKVIPISLMNIKCQWWLQAINSQITRIKENMNSESYFDQVQRMADDHFLKVSLKHLLDWLKELNKCVEETEITLKRLNSLFNIKILRDMSEHEIDYYKQIGNKQNIFIDQEHNQSLIRCLIINKEYYIGGKININDLEEILNQLDKILKQGKFTYRFEAIPLLKELMKEPIV